MNALLTELLNWLVHDLRCLLKCYLCNLPCLMVRHLKLLVGSWGLHHSLEIQKVSRTKPVTEEVLNPLEKPKVYTRIRVAVVAAALAFPFAFAFAPARIGML